jgi:hypothetical protein
MLVKKMQSPFVIVPLTRNDFEKLEDQQYMQLLASYGIKQGQVYPKVDSSVSIEDFEKSMTIMQSEIDKAFNNGDLITKESYEMIQE